MTTNRRQPTGPTLTEIRSWPATVSVVQAAKALGISRAHAYDTIRTGDFPARAIPVGRRLRVVTSSILEVLGSVAGKGDPSGSAFRGGGRGDL